MPKMKHKKQSWLTKLTQIRRFHALVFVLVFAFAGGYWVLRSQADIYNPRCHPSLEKELPPECSPHFSPNPILTRPCGLDVALLIDLSDSMNGQKLANAKDGMRLFVNTLRNTDTYIAVGEIQSPESPLGRPPFTNDTNEILKRIDSFQRGGRSYVGDLWKLALLAPRSDRPNLIIILSDFGVTYDRYGVGAAKDNGTRILALAYHDDPNEASATDHTAMMISGPNMDTGNIFTSDVVHVNPSTIGAQFRAFAQQLCFNGATPQTTPGLTEGNGGTGIGTNGQGQGQGPSAGEGGGGGGSSANKLADQPNSLPTSSSQGAAESTDQEPSPFYDGKEFKPGSDKDNLVFGNSTVAGKKVPKLVLYLISALLLGGAAGGLYWRWKKQRQ